MPIMRPIDSFRLIAPEVAAFIIEALVIGLTVYGFVVLVFNLQ